MEPLSALSVAAAVVQFVDFGSKLISKSHELYKSNDGRLVEHKHIHTATNTLTEQCRVLRGYAHAVQPAKTTTVGEDILNSTVNRSLQLAEELRQVVNELQVAGSGKRFKSFRNAIKSIWSKGRLEQMLEELQSVRAELMMSLLIVLRAENASDTQKLLDANKSLESTLLTTIKTMASVHREEVRKLDQSVRSSWYLPNAVQSRQSKINAANEWLRTTSPLVTKFNDTLNPQLVDTREQQIRQKIRGSLCFDEIFQRYDAIPDAAARTFDWAYDLELDQDKRWSSFGRWLEGDLVDDTRLYWISGKPGSGKSTLMRYLWKNPRTVKQLSVWAGSSRIILASCFFWNAGTELQRSQQGFLRTLLFQLLAKQPDFPGSLFPERWKLLEYGSDAQYAWSDEELFQAIPKFVEHYAVGAKIVLFVDGLDEYQGSEEQRQDVCKMLHDLAKHNAVKICVSSRPWNVYVDSFQEDPQLRLEDLTREDIRHYVTDRLAKNTHFKKWSIKEEEQSQQLCNSIVEKARGVFLWVYLVINNLMKSLSAKDDAYDLARRFAEIPAELENYFFRMMDDIDPFYKADAALMFEVALLGNESLVTYFYLHNHAIEFCLSHDEPKSLQDILEAQADEDRRINARCMGLLESFGSDGTNSSTQPSRMVGFLHRTARDFIQTSAVQERLNAWQTNPVNPRFALLQSYVCQLKSCDYRQPWMAFSKYQILLSKSIKGARRQYQRGDTRMSTLMQIIESSYSTLISLSWSRPLGSIWQSSSSIHSKPNALRHWLAPLKDNETDFLAWAITYGPDEYVLETLQEWTPARIMSKSGKPYLAYSACSRIEEFQLGGAAIQDHGLSCYRITQRLFELGADPNDIWDGDTVWGSFLKILADSKQQVRVALTKVVPMSSYAFLMLKAFIERGAVDVVRREKGKGTGRYIRTLNPVEVVTKLLIKEESDEIIRLLNTSAHASLTARMRRMASR